MDSLIKFHLMDIVKFTAFAALPIHVGAYAVRNDCLTGVLIIYGFFVRVPLFF